MKKILTAAASVVLGLAAGGSAVYSSMNKLLKKSREDGGKMSEFYQVLVPWLTLRQEGRNLKEYFINHDYHSVAIYGIKELGERLCCELNGTEINVAYAIDKNSGSDFMGMQVYSPKQRLEKVDAVVVTAIHYFDEIEQELAGAVDADIVSIEDVVFELI